MTPRDSARLPAPAPLVLAVLAALPWAMPAHSAPKQLPRIDVVAEASDGIRTIPGAVSVVDREALDALQPLSTEAALRGVAGVSIKPEEETAVVVNIGIRGLSAADYKSLVLEDGVPVAPGLFVGNGRYYNPRIQRMDSIEVLKGAAALRYGPSTIGGVINYKTRDPKQGVSVSARVGSHDYREATLEAGLRSETGGAVAGLFYTEARGDGFQGKGFEMRDFMAKAGAAFGDNQWASIKFSHHANDANISYRGVFLDAYRARARFNPAPDDFFLTGRTAVDLNHEWQVNDGMRLNTLLYWNQMHRDYWRYNTVAGTPTRVVNGLTVWNYADTLNGNNRAFDRTGFEQRLTFEHGGFGTSNEAEIGLRLMRESMDDQTVAATRALPRTGPLSRDVVDTADSLAVFAQNRFMLGEALAITPGLRVERYTQKRVDRRRSDAQGNRAETSNTEVLPGVGFTYDASPVAQWFGGVYRAFSPALNGDSLSGLRDQQLDAERSTNMEIGVRGASGAWRYEVTAFRMDFANQIVPANSNTDFQVTNGGETLHQGLEAAMGYDLGHGFSVDANTTWVPDAYFNGDRRNATGAITTPDGNRVTYTPEWVANLTLGYRQGPLQAAFVVHHTGEQFTDTANTVAIVERTSGFFTGQVDAYTLLDLTASYEFSEAFRVFGAVKNLTDRHYIASLRQGIYVGPSRAVEFGVRYQF